MESKVIRTQGDILHYTLDLVAGVLERNLTFGLIALLALYKSTAIIWTRYAALLSAVFSPSKASLAPKASF